MRDTSKPNQVAAENRLHHEDLEVGTAVDCGSRGVLKDEIVAFGRAWDPQPLHVDEEAAKATLVGGLCASGWHTCCIMMKMIADNLLLDTASMGAPGIEETKWLKPIRPGDSLTVRGSVTGVRGSQSKPDRGFVSFFWEVLNDRGERVMTLSCPQMIERRHPARPA